MTKNKYLFINKNKAQISLEYLLIFIGLLSVFSLFLTTTLAIYNKNEEITENKNIQNLVTEIQEIINLQELQANKAINKINLKNINLENIKIENINNKSFYIYNLKNSKKYTIKSNLNITINIDFKKHNSEKIITITKENKIINIKL